MLDIVLHTGSDHPALVWILFPSLLTFVAGLVAGASSDRLRNWVSGDDHPAAE